MNLKKKHLEPHDGKCEFIIKVEINVRFQNIVTNVINLLENNEINLRKVLER